MGRFVVKKIVAQLLSGILQVDKVFRARRDRYVLCFHRVMTAREAEKDGMHHSLWISPEGLISLIRWMREVGEIVDCYRLLDTKHGRKKPMFALTFDDGWKDTYTNAFPILKQEGVSAMVFLVSAAVESDALFWPQDITSKTVGLLNTGRAAQVGAAVVECWPRRGMRGCTEKWCTLESVEKWIEALKLVSKDERERRIQDYFQRLGLGREPLRGYVMNWEDARKMQKDGVSFGSHTHNHTILEGLLPEQIEDEVKHSRWMISDKLEIEVDSFCYPNGWYTGKEREILRDCGYRYGFRLDDVSLQQCKDYFYIPRFIVSERCARNPAYFKMRLLEMPMYRSKPHRANLEYL